MSSQETKDFLKQCDSLHEAKSTSLENDYVPPMLSSLDIDQVIAHGGCSPAPCSSPGTTTSAVTLGLGGVA